MQRKWIEGEDVLVFAGEDELSRVERDADVGKDIVYCEQSRRLICPLVGEWVPLLWASAVVVRYEKSAPGHLIWSSYSWLYSFLSFCSHCVINALGVFAATGS